MLGPPKGTSMVDRVLITGGAGFVGSHLAEHLALQGREVVILDNLSRGKLLHWGFGGLSETYNWDHLAGVPGVERVKGDVRDHATVEDLARDVDAIVHCAAQVAVTLALQNPPLDFDVNALGTVNVLEAARRSPLGPSVLMCSTNKVYGGNVNRLPIRTEATRYAFEDGLADGVPEDFPIDGCEHTPYGSSKLAADIYTQDYGRTYGLPTGVFRMSCIYGPRQFGNEDQGWVAHFILSALQGRPITLFGDGKQVRDVLYIDDLVRAMDLFLQRSSVLRGEMFNIGGGPGNSISLRELVALLEELLGRWIPVHESAWRTGDQRVYVSNVNKARALLGWRPRVSPRKGVERYLAWAEALLKADPTALSRT